MRWIPGGSRGINSLAGSAAAAGTGTAGSGPDAASSGAFAGTIDRRKCSDSTGCGGCRGSCDWRSFFVARPWNVECCPRSARQANDECFAVHVQRRTTSSSVELMALLHCGIECFAEQLQRRTTKAECFALRRCGAANVRRATTKVECFVVHREQEENVEHTFGKRCYDACNRIAEPSNTETFHTFHTWLDRQELAGQIDERCVDTMVAMVDFHWR